MSEGTCLDCYTWMGPRGSAHDPARCPQRASVIGSLRREIRDREERLARIIAAGPSPAVLPENPDSWPSADR